MHAVSRTSAVALLIAPPLLLLLGVAGVGDAPLARTPEALAEYARAHSPRARAAALERDAAARAVAGAGTLMDPMVEARVAPLSVPGLLPQDPHDPMPFGAELMVSQTLPLTGRLTHERDRARALATRASAQVDVVLLDLEREAALLACSSWQAAASLRTHQGHRALLDSLADSTRAQLASGRATVTDVQRVELDAVRIGIEIAQAEGEQRAVDAQTNGLLGRVPDAPLPAAPEQVPSLNEPPAGYLDRLIAEPRAEVRAQAAAALAFDAAHARASTMWIPDLTAKVGWSSMWPASHQLMVGVALPLPVFTDSRRAELEQADTMRASARAMQEDLQVRDLAELAAARAQDAAAARVLALLEQDIQPLAISRALSAKASLSGGASLALALETTHQEREVRLAVVRATAERCRSRAELWRALGVSFLSQSTTTVMP